MQDIQETLYRVNTLDAAFRGLVMLLCFMAAGRCGEVAHVAWNLFEMNHAFGLVFIIWRDMKNSKDKPVPLLPAVDNPNHDICLSLACAASFGLFNITAGPPTENKYLFSWLKCVQNKAVASKISGYIGDLVEGSTWRASKLRANSLNKNPDPPQTSQSLRHGSAEEMEANGVAPYIAADLSAHAPNAAGGATGGEGGAGPGYAPYHAISKKNVILGESPFKSKAREG